MIENLLPAETTGERLMRAMAVERFGGPELLQPMDLPRPKPGKGELLIRVVAAGVNPVDCKIRDGLLADRLPHAFPLIPGWDAAGVVEELGEETGRFRRGDRVWTFARKPTVQWGCYAEFVAVPEGNAGLMPTSLLYEEAASVPLAALTAYQCVFGKPGVERGSRVLVHAAAGGVGHFAVQLIRQAGAEAWGTARSANHAFVMGLGASRVLDYEKEDLAEVTRKDLPAGFDLVLDAVGGETLAGSYDLVRPGGRLVSIVEQPDPEAARERGIHAQFLFVEPNVEQLDTLARLVDRKQLRPRIRTIYSLAEAARAQTEQAERHVQGKLVLNL